MNILLIYAHPSRDSYTFQILEQIRREVSAQNWNIEVSDLYAMNFQSDMTAKEYEREASSMAELPVSEDVLAEHEKIDKADCIIFLYPVWWSDCPAKLKGWFDRVFTVGYAYKKSEKIPKMKVIPYGVVVCTAGYTNEYLAETGIAESMRNVMLDDRLGDRFENKEMVILGGTLEMGVVREPHRAKIRELMEKISTYNGM